MVFVSACRGSGRGPRRWSGLGVALVALAGGAGVGFAEDVASAASGDGFDPYGAAVPALCDHQPGRLVGGELPVELLNSDRSVETPAYVMLLTEVGANRTSAGPVVVDLDGDGALEHVGVVLCTWDSTHMSDGYHTMIVWDAAGEVLASEFAEAVAAVRVDNGRAIYDWVECNPDILVCVPISEHTTAVVWDGTAYRFVDAAEASMPPPAASVPASAAQWAPPSPPLVNVELHPEVLVPVETTLCTDGSPVRGGYYASGDTATCAGTWWPDEFDGFDEVEYQADDRYPLHLGVKGPHVEFVQSMLAALGYDVGVSGADGYYGIATYLAVVRWHIDSGGPVTTMVTVDDMKAMRVQLGSGSAPPAPAPSTAPTVPDLSGIAVPSLCGYPPGTLVDGVLPAELTAPGDLGWTGLAATADLDGDGTAEIAASFYCNGGGVGWPEQVLVLRADLSPVGVLDLSDVPVPISTWRATVTALVAEPGSIRVDGSFEHDAMTPLVDQSVWLNVVDGQLMMSLPGAAPAPVQPDSTL